MGKLELLAPAGSFECLVAAVQSGADAVYLAGKNFGARSFANNFDNEELEKAVDYCHIRGVKVYVTVNTLVLDSEMKALSDYIAFLSVIGADAVIVQDFGVAELVKKIAPELPVHASTQMTIHNSEGVEYAKKCGINRVVLSRELSLAEIKLISAKTDVELEVFAHGALCMCYSGQCLLSSIIGGRSGNRGKCAQPCRLPYSVNGQKEKSYIMSLKDLLSLKFIPDFSEMGVASLKIEGRMKGPAYVAAVVGIYRKYIDNPQKVSADDIAVLDAIFNRGGLTDGYLTGKSGKEMFALRKPDNPYLKSGAELEKELLKDINRENRKTRISGYISIKNNEYPKFCVSYGDLTAEYIYTEIPEVALKSSLNSESVIVQLNKTGGTAFEFESLDADIDDGLFVSAGVLNKIRREGLKLLEDKIVLSYKRCAFDYEENEYLPQITNDKKAFVCEITKKEQFEAVKDFDFEKFYIPISIIEKNISEFDSYRDKIVIVLPSVLKEKEYNEYVSRAKSLLDDGFHGVQIQNISLIKPFENYNIYGGFRLNVFNSSATYHMSESGMKVIELSPELTIKQIKGIRKFIPSQVMVYGRLPLTVSENCIVRNGSVCPCDGDNSITDRMGMVFPVIKDGDICRSVILNCKKTFAAFDMDKIYDAGIAYSRIYFTDESNDECKRICKTFLLGDSYRPEDFTNGHFFKGVTK